MNPIEDGMLTSVRDLQSCDNIKAENIQIESPSGNPARWNCRNMDDNLLDLSGVGCVPA